MAEPNSIPPLTRGEHRPVKRRTRTFRPNYLSFAGTYQCNLTCPHCCVPIEWTDRLDIPIAVRFLEEAHAAGIEMLGFTGGEPFLYPEFLIAADEARGRARLPLRQDDDQRRLASRRRAPPNCPDGPARRGLHRQDRPERGQVPRHGHREARGVLPRDAGRCSTATTSCRCPTPAVRRTRGWSRSTGSRKNSTAWSSGPTCSAATCW